MEFQSLVTPVQAIELKRSKTGWVLASIFLCTGLLLTADVLLLTGGGIEFCALDLLLWVLPSALWVWRRDVAASYYLPVLIALAWFVAITYKNLFPLMSLKIGLSFYVIQAVGLSGPLLLAIAAAPIVWNLRKRAAWKLPALLVCPLLLLGLRAAVLQFGDVTKTSTHEMEWTSDVDQLASATGMPLPFLSRLQKSPALPGDEPLVLLYRKVGEGYCVQAVFSHRLLAYLRDHGKRQVRVTYALRYSFGKYRGDQGVLSVDEYSMTHPGPAYDYGSGSSLVVGNVPGGTDCAR